MRELRAVSQLDSLVETIASTLGGKQIGGAWQVQCPCHEDNTASLTVSIDKGKLLLHCHAGCSYDDVTAKLRSLDLLPEKMPRASRSIVAVYEYADADGKVWFEKIRYEPKDFRIRVKQDDGSYKYSGATKEAPKVLYKLPQLAAAVARKDTVVICEGEKDADNFNSLSLAGYFATTNFEGANKWANEYTAQIASAHVIILEDNDVAGQERTKKIAALISKVCPTVKVVKFPELAPKGDFTDWVKSMGAGGTIEKVLQRIQSAEVVAVDSWAALDKAQHVDYINFVRTLPEITDLRREKLSGELFAKTKSNGWAPTDNLIRYVKGCARDYECFDLPAFEDHLERYTKNELEPQLLLELPEWDGVDRVKEICRIIRFANIGQEEFEELLKHFGAGMFRRLEDNEYQNPTIIIQGCQGCGKDSLLQALFGGLGHYFKNLDIGAGRETETIKQLHTGILFNIPEFDRTSRSEIATLKYILTTPTTDVRLSYDRRAEHRDVRCSFVASANVQDVIADHTGARRFWLFEADYLGLEIVTAPNGKQLGTGKIVESYPGLFKRKNRRDEQLQILSQFRELCKEDYVASEESLSAIRDYVASQVPDSPDELLLSDWDSAIDALAVAPAKRSSVDGGNLYSVTQVDAILDALQRRYSYPRRRVLQLLKSSGRAERSRDGRFYRRGESPESLDDDSGELF